MLFKKIKDNIVIFLYIIALDENIIIIFLSKAIIYKKMFS